jgi:hypothetical protein
MIALESTAAFTGLAARLIARARRLAEARSDEALLARRDPAVRWRKARLVWPLFTGD